MSKIIYLNITNININIIYQEMRYRCPFYIDTHSATLNTTNCDPTLNFYRKLLTLLYLNLS